MKWITSIAIAAVLAVIGLSIVPVMRFFDYYHHYRTIGEKLAAMSGVHVIGSWKHEDVFLEDFGYAVRVRECPPVWIDFHEENEWYGLFDRIDGVIVCFGDGSRDGKVIKKAQMDDAGLGIGNLPELIANLETFLKYVDDAPGAGTPRPWASGHYVIMRYPVDGCVPRNDR